MKLRHLKFIEHAKSPKEWRIDNLALQNINLLVGKNASGKTRALNVINNLAQLLSGRRKQLFENGKWKAMFDHDQQKLYYTLLLDNFSVVNEVFEDKNNKLLKRGRTGQGKIYAEKENQLIDFQTPVDQIAAVARQDALQHKFFEPLQIWGRSVFHYKFGSRMGHHAVAAVSKSEEHKFDPQNTEHVIGAFQEGLKRSGENYNAAIIKDMNDIGYGIDEIGTKTPEHVTVSVEGPFDVRPELLSLYVKENDLSGYTEQLNMSQGMFRALSVIIQINYSLFSEIPATILIDDIGEGLDFERSSRLVKLLIAKAETHSLQLILSTNDRFIMNAVPLEYWSILSRNGHVVKVFNSRNAKQKFEEFQYTGLSNFDLFALDYVNPSKKNPNA